MALITCKLKEEFANKQTENPCIIVGYRDTYFEGPSITEATLASSNFLEFQSYIVH